MNEKDEALEIIRQYKDLIRDNKFEEFYKNLEDVDIPEFVAITEIFINAGIIDEVLQKLTTIPQGMFCSTNIKKIVIPSHIISINLFAFAYCDQLKEVTIPSNFKLLLEDIFGPNCRSEINFTFI